MIPFPQRVAQGPTSSGQLSQVSPGSIVPFPQIAVQGPTSSGHVTHVSPSLIRPSPHNKDKGAPQRSGSQNPREGSFSSEEGEKES